MLAAPLALLTKLPALGVGVAALTIGGAAIGGVTLVTLLPGDDDARRIVFARRDSDRPADSIGWMGNLGDGRRRLGADQAHKRCRH